MESTEERSNETVQATGAGATQDNELSYDEMVALYDDSMRHLNEGEIVEGRSSTSPPTTSSSTSATSPRD